MVTVSRARARPPLPGPTNPARIEFGPPVALVAAPPLPDRVRPSRHPARSRALRLLGRTRTAVLAAVFALLVAGAMAAVAITCADGSCRQLADPQPARAVLDVPTAGGAPSPDGHVLPGRPPTAGSRPAGPDNAR